jgi:hypothetical protein
MQFGHGDSPSIVVGAVRAAQISQEDHFPPKNLNYGVVAAYFDISERHFSLSATNRDIPTAKAKHLARVLASHHLYDRIETWRKPQILTDYIGHPSWFVTGTIFDQFLIQEPGDIELGRWNGTPHIHRLWRFFAQKQYELVVAYRNLDTSREGYFSNAATINDRAVCTPEILYGELVLAGDDATVSATHQRIIKNQVTTFAADYERFGAIEGYIGPFAIAADDL